MLTDTWNNGANVGKHFYESYFSYKSVSAYTFCGHLKANLQIWIHLYLFTSKYLVLKAITLWVSASIIWAKFRTNSHWSALSIHLRRLIVAWDQLIKISLCVMKIMFQFWQKRDYKVWIKRFEPQGPEGPKLI